MSGILTKAVSLRELRGFPNRLGLQGRFMVHFGLIVLTLMALVVWLVENRMSTTLMQQTRMRGLAIGRSIAATVQSELLSYDYVSLQQAAETAARDEGLLYVIILDKEGCVAAFSGSPERQGAVLDDPVSVTAGVGNAFVVQEVSPTVESGETTAHLDIAVPVRVEGTPVRWGTVRVGLSLAPAMQTLAETRLLLVLLALVAVLIVLASARLLSRQITEPLVGLAGASASIATGNLDLTVNEDLVGELGDLASSFNKMTNELKRSRDAIRYQNQHLENIVVLRTSALAEKARELERVNAELKELDRLKSDFLSNVSHELRTPLTSIRSFTEIMLDPECQLETAERREFLQIVATQAERLTRLISDLLDLSKIEAGEFQCQIRPMNPSRMAASVVHTLEHLAAEKRIELRNDIPGDAVYVLGDVDRLSQVLTNLVDNAIKFTSYQGRITITAHTSAKRWPVIGVLRSGEKPSGAFAGMETHQPEEGEYLVITVRDNGIGIRAADAKRIFEKFGQVGNVLTDKPQGTGLGLAISGGIVMQHGGALWVESEPDVGSVFSFSVPLAAPAAQQEGGPRSTPKSAPNAAPEIVAAPAQRLHTVSKQEPVKASDPKEIVEAVKRSSTGKLIMVVDDEPSIVTALTELLHPHGFRTIGCYGGSEAVARARELAPDAIILDIMMPEINGYDVLRLVKSDPSTAHIPVIVLSVLDDKAKALDLGAAEYVRKPFQKEELLDNVRALA